VAFFWSQLTTDKQYSQYIKLQFVWLLSLYQSSAGIAVPSHVFYSPDAS